MKPMNELISSELSRMILPLTLFIFSAERLSMSDTFLDKSPSGVSSPKEISISAPFKNALTMDSYLTYKTVKPHDH